MALLKKKKTSSERIAKKMTRTVKNHPKTAAAAGLAAATVMGAAAWLGSRRHKGNGIAGGSAFHVESDGNSEWLLREEGHDEPVARHKSKRRVVSAAREYARTHTPSALTIHKKNGTVSERHIYADQ